MGSRQRKEQNNLDLQGRSISPNGAGHDSHGAHSAQSGRATAEEGAAARAAGEKDAQGAVAAQPAAAGEGGKIEVSPRAIAYLASRAAQRSYGVVGLASRHARSGWAELLRRDEITKGVEVDFSNGEVVVNLYVVLEYGVRISEVARMIMSGVRFALESALGVKVASVNVTVQGIRVSE